MQLPEETRRHLTKAVDLLRSGRRPAGLAASHLELAAHSVVDRDPDLGANLLDASRGVRGGGRSAMLLLHRAVQDTDLFA